MTLFLDIKKDEVQNLKLKLFLGILKEFGISVGPEKLRFGLSWGMPLRYCTPIETGDIESTMAHVAATNVNIFILHHWKELN